MLSPQDLLKGRPARLPDQGPGAPAQEAPWNKWRVRNVYQKATFLNAGRFQ